MAQSIDLFQHYNRTRTWAYIQSSLDDDHVNCKKLEQNLSSCFKNHNNILYGDHKMHGCGFEKVPGNVLLTEMNGIKALFSHTSFRDAIALSHGSIDS